MMSESTGEITIACQVSKIEKRVERSKWLHRALLVTSATAGIITGLTYNNEQETHSGSDAFASSFWLGTSAAFVAVSAIDGRRVKQHLTSAVQEYESYIGSGARFNVNEASGLNRLGPESACVPANAEFCLVQATTQGSAIGTWAFLGFASVMFIGREHRLDAMQSDAEQYMRIVQAAAIDN